MDSGTCIAGMPNARYNCCLDAAMSVIEGRWKCTIICMLTKYGPMRFSELERKIGDVSSRILSKQLKELEADGMVIRTVYPDRKLKVSYSLSERGESILPILADLAEWGARNRMVQVIVPDRSALPDLDGDGTGPRAVELAEEDPLPRSEDQAAVRYDDVHRGPNA